MARYLDDRRYEESGDVGLIDIGDNAQPIITRDDGSQIDQTTVPQVTADQNNYAIPPGELIRLSTDASRTFTGFSGSRPGLFVICNVGSQNVVIANDNAGSTAENRVLCHSGANITLNANESVLITYDFQSSRWRTIGFV